VARVSNPKPVLIREEGTPTEGKRAEAAASAKVIAAIKSTTQPIAISPTPTATSKGRRFLRGVDMGDLRACQAEFFGTILA
jgi:hypothetical protein